MQLLQVRVPRRTLRGLDPGTILITRTIPDPSQASITLAKLQNPVKSSFDSINDSLKETHSGLNKYSKSLDKVARVRLLR